MMAFLLLRDAPPAGPQVVPVAPAGSHMPGKAAILTRFPSSPELLKSLHNPSPRIYAAKPPRAASRAVQGSRAGWFLLGRVPADAHQSAFLARAVPWAA